MKATQTQAESKTDVIVRGVEAHETGEAEQILKEYQQAVSQIPEVQGVVYKRRIDKRALNSLLSLTEFDEKLSSQLSQIECRLCDEYTDWFFGFEHISFRTFSQQSRNGYTHLFSRD